MDLAIVKVICICIITCVAMIVGAVGIVAITLQAIKHPDEPSISIIQLINKKED